MTWGFCFPDFASDEARVLVRNMCSNNIWIHCETLGVRVSIARSAYKVVGWAQVGPPKQVLA